MKERNLAAGENALISGPVGKYIITEQTNKRYQHVFSLLLGIAQGWGIRFFLFLGTLSVWRVPVSNISK